MLIHNEFILIFTGLCCLLAVASGIGFVLQVRFREAAAIGVVKNLSQRIKSWWVIVFLLAGALLAGPSTLTAVFALISFVALREFLTVTAIDGADRHAVLASFLVALPTQYVLAGAACYSAFTLFIPVGAFLAIPILTALAGETKNVLARTAELLWGLMVCVYCISHVPALLMLSIDGYGDRQVLLPVFLIVVAQSSDVLQYVWGKLLGRHRIAPQLSPSKTVEGFLGGVASATALGAGLWWITPFSIPQAAAMALVIAVTGFLGGLVMSAIKRDRGLKDWSQFVPGHGGMLDRLDSLCFSAPIFFHLTRSLAS